MISQRRKIINHLQYEIFGVLYILKEVNEMDILKRINELAKKKREVGLTEDEQREQKELYKEYLGGIRSQFQATLDNVSIKEADGSLTPFKDAFPKKEK